MKFTEFLTQWNLLPELGTEDILSCILPLFRETIAAHQRGLVAPLIGTEHLQVTDQKLWFEEHLCDKAHNAGNSLRTLEAQRRHGWDVISELHSEFDLNTGEQSIENKSIVDQFATSSSDRSSSTSSTNSEPTIKYLTGYECWEHKIGHHDPLTDTFSLGMILASLALQLDFYQLESLQRFVAHRDNLFRLNSALHPVLAQVIRHTTELNRDARAQDLSTVLLSLENYRDQTVSIETQLALDQIQNSAAQLSSTQRLLFKLRDRLFDLSRRNPLLHFRGTAQSLNLTQASMPITININNISADQLMVWGDDLQSTLVKGQVVRLNQRINFNEAIYTSSVLERLIADARRDRNEYGCSQLRLVVAFLSWANLKEVPIQQYVSPLVLLPVQINKQKGIRDTFTFEALSTTAEINPVIRHQFRELYNIALPDSIELEGQAIDQLFNLLKAQIVANQPAISLTKLDRPRIELVHEKAKRRLDQYRRSSRVAGRGASRFEEIDYSYDAINYHPLGVRLFTQRVKQPEFHLQRLMNSSRPTRHYAINHGAKKEQSSTTHSLSSASPPSEDKARTESGQDTVTVERDIAVIRDSTSDNPYHWSFDLCNLTLVNLHYRRMSLVRDYEAIAEQRLVNPAFEATFHYADELESGQTSQNALATKIPLAERFEVVISDPTQSRAIAQSRTGQSYIIQGPPGTGKSQTITNLIADFVAQGKRVLFVCEKRAAIDVVYSRLSQCGLGQLCSLVHDSQTDKKEFIQDLQATYKAFTSEGESTTAHQRQQLIQQLENSLQGLTRFEEAMQSQVTAADPSRSISMRKLLDRILQSEPARVEFDPAIEPPTLAQWWSAGDKLTTLKLRLEHLNSERVFRAHPLHVLRGSLVGHDQAASRIIALTRQAIEQVEQVQSLLSQSRFPTEQSWTLRQLQTLLKHVDRLRPLANESNLTLLDPKSVRTSELRMGLSRIAELETEVATAGERTKNWRTKLPSEETRTALALAKHFQANLFRWFLPAYWRLRKLMNSHYDFSRHELRPPWLQVLEDLSSEHMAQAKLQQLAQTLQRELSLQLPLQATSQLVKQLELDLPKEPQWLRQAHQRLLKSDSANEVVADLLRVPPAMEALDQTCSQLLSHWQDQTADQLQRSLEAVTAHIDQLPAVADLIQLVDSLPESTSRFLRGQSMTYDQMEIAVEHSAWTTWLKTQPDIERFHAGEQATHVETVSKLLPQWLTINAAEVCQRARQRFLTNSAPDPKNPSLSKRLLQGRKILEHEFGKTMRYRPIRDLVDGDSGLLVRDLKPIWLMSPLSVSDTLPLASQFVDVVIFDEASQVRLEDAVPTLFRGVQTIIVGDTMQLPPTNFFAQKTQDSGDSEISSDVDVPDDLAIDNDLSADSLLRHAGKRLQSTMLGWHYRSRSESLISFSNWAFYNGQLLTVPDVTRRALAQPSTTSDVANSTAVVRERSSSYATDPSPTVAEFSPNVPNGFDWLNRPISFHFMEDGCYEDRRNRREAEKVADLVAQCLTDGSGRTIGVIAFSEAQQSEIERALEDRARDDRNFAVLYEQELSREEDGQFTGLLVKNLENIQGDERDVIILSVCYGPNPTGKISMNFGPINRDGGEKRLNVAFSRAKRHMAVVSSMRWGQISNDYNFGPSCLKQYLRYAECLDRHDTGGAQLALAQLGRFRVSNNAESRQLDTVTQQVSAALRAEGYVVDNLVGQSLFRIHAAVYREGDAKYRLGILIDTAEAYESADPWERDVMRPRLLEEFGWKIIRILGKDWWKDSSAQLQRILGAIDPSPQ